MNKVAAPPYKLQRDEAPGDPLKFDSLDGPGSMLTFFQVLPMIFFVGNPRNFVGLIYGIAKPFLCALNCLVGRAGCGDTAGHV